MSIEVKVRKGEPMERALRRLKKRLDREGVIRDCACESLFREACAGEAPQEEGTRFQQYASRSLLEHVSY